MSAGKARPRRKAKMPLTPEQKKAKEAERMAKVRKAQHIRMIKDTFVAAGFKHVNNLSATEFRFKGKSSDLDEVFILDNVIVLLEHTSSNEVNVSTHLIKKSIIYNYISESPAEFIKEAKEKFKDIRDNISYKYHDHDIQLKIVYCSRNNLKSATKDHVKNVIFLDYPQLKYFNQLSKAIKLSVRHELLDFLGVSPHQFGQNVLASGHGAVSRFWGSVLPEAQSHLPSDYTVVSFYISAGELIKRAYVLRRDGWRDGSGAYQRILIRKKIDSIRKHLLSSKGVFLNNIVAILPEKTKILDEEENHINPKTITKVRNAEIHLTEQFNSIAIIDGQHRIFSYYEGDWKKLKFLG